MGKSIVFVRCLAALAGLTLFSCGRPAAPSGERTEAAAEPATVPPPAVVPSSSGKGPVLVCFGDSLTAGYGAEPGNSYPDFLQKDLDAAGYHWRVINAGVSGETTTDGLNRVPEIIAERPRVVILEFGGNDGLRGLPLETTRANLDAMTAALKAAGIQVVLAGMTLPPNYGPEYIRPFEQIYIDLARKYGVKRIPFLLEGVGGHAKLMQRDGIHPLAQGNANVARNVLTIVKPLLH